MTIPTERLREMETKLRKNSTLFALTDFERDCMMMATELLAARDALAALTKERDEARAAVTAMERDVAALRGELSICMDCISELPESALALINEGKLLRAYQAMTEYDKHEHYETTVDRLTKERDSLLASIRRHGCGDVR